MHEFTVFTARTAAPVRLCIVSVYIVFLSSGSRVVPGLLQHASYFIVEAGNWSTQSGEG